MSETLRRADDATERDAQPAAPASGLTIGKVGKGAVGKTTTTVSLGAITGGATFVVDHDPAANPTAFVVDHDPAANPTAFVVDRDRAANFDLGTEDRTTALRRAIERTGEYDLVLIAPRPDVDLIDPADPPRAR